MRPEGATVREIHQAATPSGADTATALGSALGKTDCRQYRASPTPRTSAPIAYASECPRPMTATTVAPCTAIPTPTVTPTPTSEAASATSAGVRPTPSA